MNNKALSDCSSIYRRAHVFVVVLFTEKEASLQSFALTGRDGSHVTANVNNEMAASCFVN